MNRGLLHAGEIASLNLVECRQRVHAGFLEPAADDRSRTTDACPAMDVTAAVWFEFGSNPVENSMHHVRGRRDAQVRDFMGKAPEIDALEFREGRLVGLQAIGGLCAVIGACVLWRKLPLVREHIRPIYTRLGIINE